MPPRFTSGASPYFPLPRPICAGQVDNSRRGSHKPGGKVLTRCRHRAAQLRPGADRRPPGMQLRPDVGYWCGGGGQPTVLRRSCHGPCVAPCRAPAHGLPDPCRCHHTRQHSSRRRSHVAQSPGAQKLRQHNCPPHHLTGRSVPASDGHRVAGLRAHPSHTHSWMGAGTPVRATQRRNAPLRR